MVTVIDPVNYAVTAQIPISSGLVQGISVSPDGKTAYVTSDNAGEGGQGLLYTIDTASNTVSTMVSPGPHPLGVTVGKTGKVYVCHPSSITILLPTLQDASPAEIDEVGCSQMTISDDGQAGYVNENNQVDVLDLTTSSIKSSVKMPKPTYGSVAIAPDGKTGYISESTNLSKFGTGAPSAIDEIPVESIPYQSVVSGDGAAVYMTNQLDNTVSVLDVSTKKVADVIDVGSGPTVLAFIKGSDQLFVVNKADNTVSILGP